MWHRYGVPYVLLSAVLPSQLSVHYLPPGPSEMGKKGKEVCQHLSGTVVLRAKATAYHREPGS